MIDVCEYFNMHPTTTHGAMAYLDRLQPNEKFSRFEWQMLAICCILISAKYNESEEDVPDIATLQDITQQTITNDAVLSYELWALKRMGWKLSAWTPMAFLSAYLTSNISSAVDSDVTNSHSKKEIDSLLNKQISTLTSMVTLDHSFKPIQASLLAASILYIARKKLNLANAWNVALAELTKYSAADLLDTVTVIDRAYQALAAPESVSEAADEISSASQVYVIEGSVQASGELESKSSKREASPTSVSAGVGAGNYSPVEDRTHADHLVRAYAIDERINC
jgi:hypothetical protein